MTRDTQSDRGITAILAAACLTDADGSVDGTGIRPAHAWPFGALFAARASVTRALLMYKGVVRRSLANFDSKTAPVAAFTPSPGPSRGRRSTRWR